jgi:hypothetical protein
MTAKMKSKQQDEKSSLSEDHSKNNDSQNDRENDKQAARFVARILLISAGTAQLGICPAGVLVNVLDVFTDDIELAALLLDNVRDIAEQLVQFTHALFNVADLSLPLDDQGLLEIDLALVCQTRLLFQLLLLELTFGVSNPRFGFIHGCSSSDCRCALLLQGTALDGLEFL